MKKSILILALILNVIVGINAQDYKPMITDGSEWDVYYTYEMFWNEHHTITGDSIVNENNYKVLNLGSIVWDNQPILLREDTISKKVFQLIDENTERLIFDFSLEIGASFIDFTYETPMVFTVDVISNQLDLNLNSNGFSDFEMTGDRKVYYLSSSVGVEKIWIEGIGNPYGLIYSSYQSGILLCHFDREGVHDFKVTGYSVDSCLGDVWSGVKEIEKSLFNISPNPSTGLFFLDNKEKEDLAVEIFDTYGKLVFSDRFTNSSRNELDLRYLPSNIYILKTETKNKIEAIKIVIK